MQWIGIGPSKFYAWKQRYGKVNEHNAWVPRDHWLETWEKLAIVAFHTEHPLEGYRRLTHLMMDQDVVAASPATVYRVLAEHGCFERWNRSDSKKGSGLQQPFAAARVLACGYFVRERLRHVLLFNQRAGRLQPVPSTPPRKSLPVEFGEDTFGVFPVEVPVDCYLLPVPVA